MKLHGMPERNAIDATMVEAMLAHDGVELPFWTLLESQTTHLAPFLPMTRELVHDCIQTEVSRLGGRRHVTADEKRWIVQQTKFSDATFPVLAVTGCQHVSRTVELLGLLSTKADSFLGIA